MRPRPATLIAACILALLSHPARGQFRTLETDRLRLIYFGRAQEYMVPYVAQTVENASAFYENLFGYRSPEKLTVLIHDFGDYGNAGAGTVPRNHIVVTIAPYDYSYETTPANERMNSTMNHEMVHIVTMDMATGSDSFFRHLFLGKVREVPEQPLSMLYGYLTSPRRSSPRWYREGLAVFMETWMAGGLGRALGSYDEMVFRTLVQEDAHIYTLLGLVSEGTKVDFQVGVNAYLYGTRFMSYLALKYGADRLLLWYTRYRGSHKYFAAQFEAVYGMSMEDAWGEWIEWERGFQQLNLASIRRYPVTSYRDIARPLGSVSRAAFDPDDRALYVAVNYPGRVAHIASIDVDTGEMERLHDVKGAALFFVTSLAYDPSSKTIFYTTDNNEWRDLCALDVSTRRSRRLLEDARVGDLSFCPADSSLWGVRRFNGISTLVRIPHPYTEWNQVYSFPFGKDLYDIDVSPDGSLVTSGLSEISGRQTLIAMRTDSLLAGKTGYETLFDFENSIPANFVFTADGRHLYGSSYYSGVSNVYRYDFDIDDMWITSNCETGMFRPVPLDGDSVIAFRYSSRGFVPCVVPAAPLDSVGSITLLGQRIVEEHPVVKSWIIASPGAIAIDSLTTYRGEYHSMKYMGLNSVYPVVEGYKQYGAAGLHADFSDPIGLHMVDATFSYTGTNDLPENERIHAALEYNHRAWGLHGSVNRADFYDLFGPTRTSRKGYNFGASYERKLLLDEPRSLDLSVDIDRWGDLETLPEYQDVASTAGKLTTGGIRLGYSHRRSSLGAVDYEQGFKWSLATSAYYALEEFFPRAHATFDVGVPFLFDHSSVWLRTAGGGAHGDDDEPFANYFFGGFRNNWVDYQAVKRYREYYTFPGAEINEIAGQTFGRVMLEWNLPPVRFRGIGTGALYNSWIRTSLFATTLFTDFDNSDLERTLGSVGAQMDFRFIALSNLKFTFSIGYAAAVEDGRKPSDEFMFSLKIL